MLNSRNAEQNKYLKSIQTLFAMSAYTLKFKLFSALIHLDW